MNKMTRRTFGVAGLAVLLVTSASFAQQQPPPVRVRGTIEAVDGGVLTVKSRDGSNLTVKLADNARVSIAVKIPLSEVKANSYVAVTAMPQADGSQRAIEVMIFPEAQRGTGEGAWALGFATAKHHDERHRHANGRQRGWAGADGEVQGRREENHRSFGRDDHYHEARGQDRSQARGQDFHLRRKEAAGRNPGGHEHHHRP
jgi:hypothetical protein